VKPSPANTVIILGNEKIEAGILPAIGGRVVFLRRPGKESIIKSDESLWGDGPEERPALSSRPGWKSYNGHIVWLGPQADWWAQQNKNRYLKKERADWPPDPYHCFAEFKVLEHTADTIRLQGPQSPITGIQLTKTITLSPTGTVRFAVAGKNIRKTPVAWDLWLNTRVDGYADCYVPVAPRHFVKIESKIAQWRECAAYEMIDGFFHFLPKKPSRKVKLASAKALMYPQTPLMAAFNKSQVLLIRFPMHKRDAIHPLQGLVEFYNETTHDKTRAISELEYHAPYKTLMPGQSMETWEEWEVLPYQGGNHPRKKISFLNKIPPQQ
jgi:hypothetical protein